MTNQTTINHIETSQKALRYCYVKNPYPCYKRPRDNINPPRIIQAMRNAVIKNKPSWSVIWRTEYRFHGITKKPIIEHRSINLHRRRAIDAMAECIASHVNIITCKVHASLSQISNWCGLTTYSKKGIPSYSRVSRAITEHFEAIGAVTCERKWDKTTGSYIPNIIWVNQLFFELIGFEYGKFKSAQNQQLAWENKGLKKKGEKPISFSEARRRAKDKHIAAAFAIRAKMIADKNLKKYAKKLAEIDEQSAKAQIQKDLIKIYTKEELSEMGYVEFLRLVNKRYYTMKKIAISNLPYKPPPDRTDNKV